MQMQEEETLLQLFGALGGHFQVEFSYGTIPAVFITSLFVCVCVCWRVQVCPVTARQTAGSLRGIPGMLCFA